MRLFRLCAYSDYSNKKTWQQLETFDRVPYPPFTDQRMLSAVLKPEHTLPIAGAITKSVSSGGMVQYSLRPFVFSRPKIVDESDAEVSGKQVLAGSAPLMYRLRLWALYAVISKLTSALHLYVTESMLEKLGTICVEVGGPRMDQGCV